MLTTRDRLNPSLLITGALVISGFFHLEKTLAEHSIVLPNPGMFGKQIGSVSPLIAADRETDSVFPENVHLDLNGPIVYGVMATYSESITFQDLVGAVNRKHKKWTRDPEGEMAKWGVAVWRNEADRHSIQVADSRVIMIWLDRHVTESEIECWSGVLCEAAVEALKLELKEPPKTAPTDAK